MSKWIVDIHGDIEGDYEILEEYKEPKTGRWIPTGYDGYADGNPVYDWWECSECGGEHTGDEDTLTPYCPYCGAEMKEGD